MTSTREQQVSNEPSSGLRGLLRTELALLGGMAALKLLLHFCFNSYYGYQRDELYFIACGEHLAWGYVDVGPLAMWLGRLSREVLGESLFALRFFPAVAGAATVFLTGLLAREFGAKRWGQFLAALTVIIAPVWVQSGNILALPSFEPFFWVLGAYLVVRIVKENGDSSKGNGDSPVSLRSLGTVPVSLGSVPVFQGSRTWLLVGVVAGFGLLNKPSMLFFGGGLALGLLLTPHRKHFANKWLWLGGLIALLIVSPFVYWQMSNDWATVRFLIGMNRTQMRRIPRLMFLIGQVIYVHPFNAPIWLAGLGYLLLSKTARPFRVLAWIYLVPLAVMVAIQSKIYYLAPAYPMLLAAGACVVEGFLAKRRASWPKVAIPAALVLGGLVTVPVGLPVLPIDKLDAYVDAVTFGAVANAYEVTGTFHDQHGWEEQVATVAKVYHGLPPDDRDNCIIFARNFGEAGAIDFYGPAHGLPKAYSVHQNYYFWGPPPDGKVTVVVGVSRERLEPIFADVEQAAVAMCEGCMPYENNLPIFVCRGQRTPYKELWPVLLEVAFRN